MEIRTLKYFLAAAREENMTRAAEQLHVTQPTLSKALKALEDELGKKLFTRHSFSIRLTDEGMLLRGRAEDLVSMADRITREFVTLDDITGGDIYLGLAESYQIRALARAIRSFRKQYPELHYHITSGDTEQVTEKLDRGLLDFSVLAEMPDTAKYDHLAFPQADRWGLVFPADDPLAAKKAVTADDLKGLPLFCSEQSWRVDIPRWAGDQMADLRLEGSFRLSYNGSMFALEGLGYLLTFDHLIDTSPGSGLVFRPLSPALETKLYLIWKKYQPLSPIAERFLKHLKDSFAIRDDPPEKRTCPDIPSTLGTARLILRPWREEDAKECYRYARDPRVGPIAGWPAHSSEEESRRVIRDILSRPETYAIVLRETGMPIGSIDLNHNDLAEEDDEAELGYWLGVPYWGKGIVPEAAREILRHAFEDLGLRRVWCGYYDGNLRSRRVQEKLGFRYQWTSQNVEVPQMNETRTGHVSLLTRDQWRVSRSLDSFDNHDPRIPYYELLLEKDLDDMPEPPLPAGYHYRYYAPGDKETWIDIEKSAKEFETHGEGEDAWKRYYAGRESELENRMFFVTDDSGQVLATATAFYDIHTGDNLINGWLHWVAVRRDAQGRGLSKPLIAHALRHMKKLGYGHAVVPTQTTTWLACKVYLDLGFRPMPGNLKRSGTGWRIIRTLTDHPALDGLAPVPEAELIKKE